MMWKKFLPPFVNYFSDEEIGGENGMRFFMKTSEFKNLNVGIVLDEGLATPSNCYTAFYGERNLWCKLIFSIAEI